MVGVGSAGTRVSLATFSSSPVLHFGFNDYTSASSIRAAILGTPYSGGATLTSNALTLVESTMATADNGITPLNSDGSLAVSRVLVVITDVQATAGYEPAEAAASLRENTQTKILACGIGSSTSQEELESMASEPTSTNVFTVPNIPSLALEVNALVEGICAIARQTSAPSSAPTNAPSAPSSAPTNAPTSSPTPSPTPSPTLSPTPSPTLDPTKAPTQAPTKAPTIHCPATLDLMFLVDASISINYVVLGGAPNTYQDLILPFVASLAEVVDVGGARLADGSLRVSMASFASSAEEHVAFDAHTDAVALRAAIEASPYAAAATFTSLGLELVNNTVLAQARALDAGIPRVLIVITDGAASVGFDPSAAAADVRAQHTSILTVGLNTAPLSELIAMASSPTGDNVFQVTEFNQLASMVSAIGAQACEMAGTSTPTCGVNILSDSECASLIGDDPAQCNVGENVVLCELTCCELTPEAESSTARDTRQMSTRLPSSGLAIWVPAGASAVLIVVMLGRCRRRQVENESPTSPLGSDGSEKLSDDPSPLFPVADLDWDLAGSGKLTNNPSPLFPAADLDWDDLA